MLIGAFFIDICFFQMIDILYCHFPGEESYTADRVAVDCCVARGLGSAGQKWNELSLALLRVTDRDNYHNASTNNIVFLYKKHLEFWGTYM